MGKFGLIYLIDKKKIFGIFWYGKKGVKNEKEFVLFCSFFNFCSNLAIRTANGFPFLAI
jgi:hypothetical protein